MNEIRELIGEGSFFRTCITVIGSACFMLFGALDLLFRVLLVFIVTDFITGIIKGQMREGLSAEKGWKGLMKKVGILIAILVANQMDKVAGTETFKIAIITFFIANEGISITENLTLMGVPLPSIMVKTLKAWKQESEVDYNESN